MHGFIRNPGSCDVVIDRLGHLARAFLGASGVETVEISRAAYTRSRIHVTDCLARV